ncbi:checkpoint protein HUS1 isoform X1 [Exaiptasia diaphana]|uniref:Checkpoint protein n=1 Tax=Exaiptasia diaphana TaxID=2652724 RepID=A0A913YBI7_EXADI|nr:checkpoint protein HUS1 isoform X1 [Exaiptasia diaphana]XP_020917231.1 checkpoint protein HUS1 isoform X1 [Exaiptasia diaphana]
MRFRAKIVEISCIQRLTHVFSTLSRMAKVCVLLLTPSKLCFIFAETAGSCGGVSIWSELTQENIFDEYRIEGVDESNNIFLEMVPENLLRAMKSATNALSVKIKLTKKHTPCLTFEINLPSQSSHSRIVIHDVPVGVIPQRNWEEYAEPQMPNFDVSIYMPQIKTVRNVVERMKNLSNYMTISANLKGSMTLGVDTDIVTVETHFKNLDNPNLEGDDSYNQDKKELAQVRIEIKKILTFLQSQQVSPDKVICNFVDNQALQFFFIHDDLSLQYLIPAVSR